MQPLNPYIPGLPLLNFAQSSGAKFVNFSPDGSLGFEMPPMVKVPALSFSVMTLDSIVRLTDLVEGCYVVRNAEQEGLKKVVVTLPASVFAAAPFGTHLIVAHDWAANVEVDRWYTRSTQPG